MASYVLSGLNLRSYPLGENDKIVVLLTRERGIVRLVARGSRKAGNRWGGRLEPLVRSDLEAATTRGSLDLLVHSQPRGPSARIMADFDCLLVGLRLAEAAMAVVAENEANPAAFDVMDTALDLLADGARPALVGLWGELGLLDAGGYRPELEDCVVCGRPVLAEASGPLAFAAASGGVRCQTCPVPSRMVPAEAIALLAALRRASPEQLPVIHDALPGEREASQVLAEALRTSADGKFSAGELWRRLAE